MPISRAPGRAAYAVCEFCSRPARHTCRDCNKQVCDMHYNAAGRLCAACTARKAKELAHMPAGRAQGRGAIMLPDTCAVCSSAPKFTCKICSRKVCEKHFDGAEDMCVMCAIRKHREEAKKGA